MAALETVTDGHLAVNNTPRTDDCVVPDGNSREVLCPHAVPGRKPERHGVEDLCIPADGVSPVLDRPDSS